MPRSSSTTSLNSYDLYKLAAIGLMTLDHVGEFVLDADWLRVLGRAAAPIFCFLAGFNGKYQFRRALLIGAIGMSVVDVTLTGSPFPLNILWPILLTRVILERLKEKPQPDLLLIVLCMIWLPVSVVVMQYGTLVLLWALWGRAVKAKDMTASGYFMMASIAGALLGNIPWNSWDVSQQAAAVAVTFAAALVLKDFKVSKVKRKSRMLHWLSRHAMHYYVAHRAFLMALGALA